MTCIKFPNGFIVKCIGGYGKSSICDLLIHYYDCIEIEDDVKPNLIIVLTEKGYKNKTLEENLKEVSSKEPKVKETLFKEPKVKETLFLLGPQTKEELENLKLYNVPLYTVAMNEVYKMYKHLNFPIYDYINLGLVLGAYKLQTKLEEFRPKLETEKDITLLNLKNSYISIEIEKNFSLRYSMMNENVRFVYESGVSEIGTLLCLEWVKHLARENKSLTEDLSSVYTIFDIDVEDLEGKDLIDFLIPFTILGPLQKGFLIVNSDIYSEGVEGVDSEKSLEQLLEPGFDFSLYNSLKTIWNSKEYIPRRKKLSEPLQDYQMFRDEEEKSDPINFEECIRKPPIFIIDTLESIKQWIQDHVEHFPEKKQIFVYVSKKKKI